MQKKAWACVECLSKRKPCLVPGVTNRDRTIVHEFCSELCREVFLGRMTRMPVLSYNLEDFRRSA